MFVKIHKKQKGNYWKLFGFHSFSEVASIRSIAVLLGFVREVPCLFWMAFLVGSLGQFRLGANANEHVLEGLEGLRRIV